MAIKGKEDLKKSLLKYSKAQLVAMIASERSIQVMEPVDVIESISSYRFKEQEYFIVVTLDGSHSIISVHEISKGIVNQTLVHPREVFRPAIADNATAIVIAHNHPSGSLDPSNDDKNVTTRLKAAGDIIGIKVLDHVIIAPSVNYYSFLEHGIF